MQCTISIHTLPLKSTYFLFLHQQFYEQAFGSDVLEIIKDSKEPDREKLDPDKVRARDCTCTCI